MSGIAGFYYLDNRSVEQPELERMTNILSHRGPDDVGLWYENSVGLGHRMYWTTPESLQEKLPFVSQNTDLVITADARVDNRSELISLLGLSDRPTDSVTDSQLILEAYKKWGRSCPEKLIGDFAFSIWDKHKQSLFCARDCFGVKPFYYYHQPGKLFVFGSEIKALLQLREVPRQLNEVRIADLLEVMFKDKVSTFHQEIFRLPPAHCMTVCNNNLQLQSYWDLNPKRELRLSSNEEYAEAYREVFTEAVRCRLRTAFPIGSTLSGGLDSSSITCVMRELLGDKAKSQLHTFSVIYNERTECDEQIYMNAVLEQGGLTPHFVPGDQIGPLTDLDQMLWHQDEPFYAPNWFGHWGMWKVAQQQDVRIVLDGLFGDSTVSHGFGYLHELASKWRWLKLFKEVKGLTQINERHRNSTAKLMRQLIWGHGMSPWIPKLIRQVWQTCRNGKRSGLNWDFNPIVNPEFARRVNLVNRVQSFNHHPKARIQSERIIHYNDLTSGDYPFMMETIDKTSAAFPLEVRFPFMDRRLAEFCLSLPPEQKYHQGWTRMIVRRSLAGTLPENIQWRRDKARLGSNVAHGLLNFHTKTLESIIFNDSTAIEPYVDVTMLREIYQRFVKQVNNDDAQNVWLAVVLACSLRHMDKSGKFLSKLK